MKLNLRQQSNWLFAQIAIIGTALVIIFLGFFYKISQFTFTLLGNMAIGKAQAACGCQIASSSSFSAFTGFILVLGLAAVIAFALALGRAILALIKTKRFIAAQQINFVQPSNKLSHVAGSIGIEKQVVEVQTDKPLIFCSGLQQPKIYISSAVIQALNYPELRAVLLHETHHLLSREPARLLLIKFMSVFNFIPGIKNLNKKYLSFSEMAADELATDNFTDKNHLATAMAKVLEMEEASIIQKELALSYFSQITEERVLALSDSSYAPSFKKEVFKTILGLAGAGILLLLCSLGIKAQQAHAQEAQANSGCADILYVEKCNSIWGNCANKVFHEKSSACKKSTPYLKK